MIREMVKMSKEPLGKLERIDIRSYWANEASDFTPWLAQDENIALLGETLEIDIEVQQSEQRVGLFRADIVCVDTATGHKVLIENQLEWTDHAHLGQLLTYAAGLDAVTIIWIADRFTEEHRAALDWLNRVTEESVNFFGCEIELWTIGDSPPAAKFNVIAKPNEWTKVTPPTGPLTAIEQTYLEFWTALREALSQRKTPIRMGKPAPQSWMLCSVGRSSFVLCVAVSKKKQLMYVQLVIYEPDRLACFHLLEQQKSEIEKEIGSSLEWRELPEKQESQIRRSFQGVDPGNKADWPRQRATVIQTLETFHAVFAPRVKALNPTEWQPDEADA